MNDEMKQCVRALLRAIKSRDVRDCELVEALIADGANGSAQGVSDSDLLDAVLKAYDPCDLDASLAEALDRAVAERAKR